MTMNTTRTSPMHDQFAELNPQWDVVRGMRMAARLAGDEPAARDSVAIADLSCLDRAGIKGPEAARWLESLHLPVPAQANEWTGLPGGGVIARLGRTEFFLEDGVTGDSASRVRDAPLLGIAGVYPVIRQDAAIAVVGRRVNELLVQICNVNFQELDSAGRTVIMTMMVGVAVLVIRQDHRNLPGFRVWCDASYAPYLWETLTEIASELGGGPVGTAGMLPQAAKPE